MIGKTISHYKILEKLGEGGMGEVYAAEDTTLGREVALKVLPREMATKADRLQRFRREARAVASLNHPNIVTIYSVEDAQDAEGVPFLTMELVEGESLSARVRPGGLPLESVLEVAGPLAEALAVAHERGITHRDLKPANVMFDREGRPKILDFGLAKLHEDSSAGEDEPTAAPPSDLTEAGAVLGTLPYMAPERVQGRPADHLSDIFSLGERGRGLEWGRRALAIDPSDPMILYNVACLFSQAGETDPAVETLERAVDAGFGHRDWIVHDSDFDALREDPRFQKLLERL